MAVIGIPPDVDARARAHAAALERLSAGCWMVIWGPHSRRFFAFFLGRSHTGIWVEAGTTGELWPKMTAADGGWWPSMPPLQGPIARRVVD